MDCDWDFQLKNPGLASSELTNGVARTGQRALLYATGMDEEDMKKPFVAVINSFSEMVPGHMHMRELAEQVKYGILEGGGIPRETGTIAICDGLCQGHCGMRYPLPSRDLIADSIEMVVQAHHFDAMVLIPGCDKIIPGMLMAAARLDIPAIVVTGGPMLPGNVGGNPLFCSSELREFPGRVEQGSCTVEEMKKAEEAALPTVGSCAHLGTANSMCMLTEVLGMSLPGCGTAPAVSNRRKRIAKQSGRQVMELLRRGITPRQILTREALLNGVAGAMATGSSTNLVLHLLAIAHEAGVELTLDDFDRISREVPFVCNLQPHRLHGRLRRHSSGAEKRGAQAPPGRDDRRRKDPGSDAGRRGACGERRDPHHGAPPEAGGRHCRALRKPGPRRGCGKAVGCQALHVPVLRPGAGVQFHGGGGRGGERRDH